LELGCDFRELSSQDAWMARLWLFSFWNISENLIQWQKKRKEKRPLVGMKFGLLSTGTRTVELPCMGSVRRRNLSQLVSHHLTGMFQLAPFL